MNIVFVDINVYLILNESDKYIQVKFSTFLEHTFYLFDKYPDIQGAIEKFSAPLLKLLTLKAPNKIFNRRHFNFIFRSFSCEAEDSLETSSLIFSEKQ